MKTNYSFYTPNWISYYLIFPIRRKNHSRQPPLSPVHLPLTVLESNSQNSDVPTFDSNIIHWKQFWEQFTVSVHNRLNLSNAEKIVYLQHAIKDGSARNAIEGLSHSGENYNEAIECLKARYDQPCLIHRTHVQMIVDAQSLKEGTVGS